MHARTRSLRILLSVSPCSLRSTGIGDTGVQALAEGLKHCLNMEELK